MEITAAERQSIFNQIEALMIFHILKKQEMTSLNITMLMIRKHLRLKSRWISYVKLDRLLRKI